MPIDCKQVFVHYLTQLSRLIEKLQSLEGGERNLAAARLAEDMFALGVQAKVAANFALRGCCGLAGVAIPEYDADTASLYGVRSHIDQVLDFIKDLDIPISEKSECEVDDKAGFRAIKMPASDYISLFVLPNFFFHLSMVYATAKNHGASVTKGDFDGIHQYPAGFSWER